MTDWERLGIAPTTDKRIIKKAYAAKVKDCHQEDEPEGWVKLHDAYKSALKYAEAGVGREKKAYTAYREQGKDFLHGEQAKTVYHSPWEQAKLEKHKLQKKEEQSLNPPKIERKPELSEEEAKPELLKQESPGEEAKPEPRKEERSEPRKEAKPEPRRKESKPESPKENPKPESREKELKKKLRTEKSKAPEKKFEPKLRDNDRELTDFFDQMLGNARESEKKLTAQLRTQLEELSQAAPGEEAEKWKEFLESPVSQKLYCSEDYWSAVFTVFYKKELQKGTYQIIYEELQYVLSTLSLEMSLIRSRIENCMKSCEKRMQRQEEKEQEERERQKKLEQRTRNEQRNRRTSFAAACLILLLLCTCKLLSCASEYYGTNPKITSERAVKTKLTSYLNEKYSTQKYQADEFELYELPARYRYENNRRKNIEVGYRATLPGQQDFCAIILFQYDDEGKPKDSVCFDNIQLDEIEDSMEAEVKGYLDIPQAVGFLSAGEGDMVAGAINSADAVYHTFFTDEITTFMEEEEQVRGQIYQTYEGIETYSVSGELNGSFILYYPDAQIPDLNTLFTVDLREDGKDVAEKLKTLQEKLHIQMIAVKVPQSYYNAALKKNVQFEGRGSNIMRSGYSNTRLTVPLNPAFVSMWVMEYHSKSSLPALWGEEESWVHVPKIAELEKGVYALPRECDWFIEEKAEDVLYVEIDEKTGKILVDADEECQREYVIVIDKQIFGIEDHYEVRRVNPEDAEDVMVYDSYPYNDIKDYAGSYNMFEGEDKLFIDYRGWTGDELEIIWQP